MKLRLDFSSLRNPLLIAALSTVTTQAFASGFTDGLIEDSLSAETRPQLSSSEIAAFLPDIGPFNFPAPYNSQAVRLTNADSCGGADCVNPVGYAYWRNINYHVNSDSMLILAGLDQSQGGSGPNLISYNKSTDQVSNLGPLFESGDQFSWSSTEGWYFSGSSANDLYISDSTKLYRYDVMNGTSEMVFDIVNEMGSDYTLWQTHSSDDDRVHSATVRNSSSYEMLGCVAYEEDSGTLHYFPKQGTYDECQIDRSGAWLVIKENLDGNNGEDNRVIELATGNERIIYDELGAAGHSDLGHGYMVAADNWASDANTQKVWNFADSELVGRKVYANTDWNISAPAHVSHTNSRPGVDPSQQYACGSSANLNDGPHANEVVCFYMDGSMQTLVVAPVMTDLSSAEGGTYVNSPKGNLDVSGQYFIWSSNAGGSRRDLYLVKIPGSGAPITDTTSSPSSPTSPSTVDNTDTSAGSGSGTESITDGTSTSDATAPQVAVVSLSSVTDDSATIRWQTNELTDGQIEYGPTSTYGSITLRNNSLTTGHEMRLSGLQSATTYHYRVRSRDAAGNPIISGDYQFTTMAASGQAGAATEETAVWISTPSAGQVMSGYIELVAEANDSDGIAHVQFIVDGMEVGSADTTPPYTIAGDTSGLSGMFTISARATDKLGNSAESDPVTIELDNLVPQISNLTIDSITETSATISWTTNEPSQQVVTYGTENAHQHATLLNTGMATKHSVVLNDLATETNYQFQVYVRDAAKNIGASWAYQLYTSVTNETIFLGGTASWTNLLNAELSGGTLTKKGGCNGCADAGAISSQYIDNGNGYLEFPATVANNKIRYVGLGGSDSDYTPGSLDFAFGLNGNVAEIRENGVYRADVTFNDGDMLRIELINGAVSYLKNGQLVYTSQQSASSSLRAVASLLSQSSSVSGVAISSASSTTDTGNTSETSTSGSGATAGSSGPINWVSLENVTVDGDYLRKTAGCDGCSDAGAAADTLLSGSGHVEFVAGSENLLRVMGLSDVGYTIDGEALAYAMYLNGTYVEIRERGQYRADVAVTAGDVLRIELDNGQISYSKNGAVFYTSSQSTSQSLQPMAVLYSMDSTIQGASLVTQ